MNLEKLRSLRIEASKTLEDIAKLLEISTNTYFYKETGRIKVSLKEANTLAKYFNISIEDLFFEK